MVTIFVFKSYWVPMSLASSILIRNVRVPCSLQILKKKNILKKIFLHQLYTLIACFNFFHFFNRRCLFVSAIMLLSLVLRPYWVTLLFNFFQYFRPVRVCLFNYILSMRVQSKKSPSITLKSIRNLSVVSEIDRIPWRKNCDRTVQGRISYFYYVTFPSFLFLYQAVDFKCNPLVRMLSYFVK